MEPMTMVFTSPALLDGVKPGDAIKFTAERVNGQLTVMEIETAR